MKLSSNCLKTPFFWLEDLTPLNWEEVSDQINNKNNFAKPKLSHQPVNLTCIIHIDPFKCPPFACKPMEMKHIKSKVLPDRSRAIFWQLWKLVFLPALWLPHVQYRLNATCHIFLSNVHELLQVWHLVHQVQVGHLVHILALFVFHYEQKLPFVFCFLCFTSHPIHRCVCTQNNTIQISSDSILVTGGFGEV